MAESEDSIQNERGLEKLLERLEEKREKEKVKEDAKTKRTLYNQILIIFVTSAVTSIFASTGQYYMEQKRMENEEYRYKREKVFEVYSEWVRALNDIVFLPYDEISDSAIDPNQIRDLAQKLLSIQAQDEIITGKSETKDRMRELVSNLGGFQDYLNGRFGPLDREKTRHFENILSESAHNLRMIVVDKAMSMRLEARATKAYATEPADSLF